ncbi:MAG: hypothetical protein Hens2KO_16500 [Henriciella sp.]
MNELEKEDGREARKSLSRARLMEAAFALLKTDGPDALTMRKLAIAANMAPATAYNVFGSKHALFEAMFNRLNDLGPERNFADIPGDELENALTIADQISRNWTDPKGHHRVLFEASKMSGSLASILLPKVVPRLIGMIEYLKNKGWISNRIPTRDLADRIAYANAGLFEAWLDARVPDADLARNHRLNILVALYGVATADKSKRFELALDETLNTTVALEI